MYIIILIAKQGKFGCGQQGFLRCADECSCDIVTVRCVILCTMYLYCERLYGRHHIISITQCMYSNMYSTITDCDIAGNAAYLAANHHVYIVMNILTVSMMLVIVPYLLLYRTMKPAQQAQLLSTVDSVDAIELSGMTNNHLEEQNDKDGLMLKHSTYVDVGDIGTSDSSSDSVSELDQGVSEEREGGGGDRVQGSGKRVDSERALLLGDVELGEDELEEDQL